MERPCNDPINGAGSPVAGDQAAGVHHPAISRHGADPPAMGAPEVSTALLKSVITKFVEHKLPQDEQKVRFRLGRTAQGHGTSCESNC